MLIGVASVRVSSDGGYGTGHGVELGHLSGGLHDSLGGYGSYGGGGFDHGLHGHVQHHYAPAVPVSEHVEITKPVPVPVIKNVGKSHVLKRRSEDLEQELRSDK